MHRMVVVLCSHDDSQNPVLDPNQNCCYLEDIGMQPNYCYLHWLVVQHLKDSMEYCEAYGCNDYQGIPSVDIYVVVVVVIEIGDITKNELRNENTKYKIVFITFSYQCPFCPYLCLCRGLGLYHDDLYLYPYCDNHVVLRHDNHRTSDLFCDHYI